MVPHNYSGLGPCDCTNFDSHTGRKLFEDVYLLLDITLLLDEFVASTHITLDKIAHTSLSTTIGQSMTDIYNCGVKVIHKLQGQCFDSLFLWFVLGH